MSTGRAVSPTVVRPSRLERTARACAAKAPAPVVPMTFSRAVPLRSVSDVDPFMRVKRPFN